MKTKITTGNMTKGQRKAHKARMRRDHGQWMAALQHQRSSQITSKGTKLFY